MHRNEPATAAISNDAVGTVDALEAPRLNLLPRELSDAELELFVSTGVCSEVAMGATIFRRDEFGRHLFVVESGAVRLEFGGEIHDKTILSREFFGELALFVGAHARMANATALEPCRLRVIGSDKFQSLLQAAPDILARFMLRSFSYLVASEQQLIQNLRRRNEELMQTLDSLHCARGELGAARQLSLSDELTGLANRRGLYQRLEALRSQLPADTPLGLLLVDVDDFKQINDGNGHLAGDRVLQAVADELRAAAGACDIACRLGGDEFALLLVAPERDGLETKAQQLVAGIRKLASNVAAKIPAVSISVGGSRAAAAQEWANRYSDADTALYRVKAEGGDGWSIC